MTLSLAARAVEIIAHGEEETREIAALVGKAARPGDVVCLIGPLGSGKTTFAQGFARAVGVRGGVTSPTFAIARRYRTKRATIHHLDLFRLAPKDLPNLALEEMFEDPGSICLVEWPEVARVLLPEDHLEVSLSHGDGVRALSFRAFGPRSGVLLNAVSRHASGKGKPSS